MRVTYFQKVYTRDNGKHLNLPQKVCSVMPHIDVKDIDIIPKKEFIFRKFSSFKKFLEVFYK